MRAIQFWYKRGSSWFYYDGFYLDGKPISIKLSYLLGNLFYNQNQPCKKWWQFWKKGQYE